MAIDVLKRHGKSAVTGLLGKNLRRVAGNIGSVMSGESGIESSQTAPLNRSKQSTNILSFRSFCFSNSAKAILVFLYNISSTVF